MSGVDGAEVEHARRTVLEAGQIAMRYFRGRYERWEKEPGQIVTEADIAVDAYLKQRLPRADRGDAWLSEETPDDGARIGAERIWVVDPIDGTRSFAEGRPEFTICVGLLIGGRAVLGLVLNPATGELFEGVRGQGAKLNGQPLALRPGQRLDGARIAVSETETKRRRFDRLLPRCEVSSIGSLAYKLVLVAAGRFDAYLSWRFTQDWDIAATMPILAETGIHLTDARGIPITLNAASPRHDGIVAAPPDLHAELLAATTDAQAVWDHGKTAQPIIAG